MKRFQPLKVILRRDNIIESIHNAHAVVCDNKGRILMASGDPEYQSFIRSALKPFQSLPFISSGTNEKINCGDKAIAISCGSHLGSTMHAREAFQILWNSDVDINLLQCPIPENKNSNLQHNCSGKHASFLATCKKMNWPLQNYLEIKHPLQIEIIRKVSELLSVTSKELVTAKDDCGAPTIFLKLSQMAALYAHLSCSNHPELEQVSRAIIANPELIGGKGRFDTELIQRAHGQLISKGGSEGIQCLGRLSEGIGLAIKVEDGSKRAKYAVAVHLLKQLEWLTPSATEELSKYFLELKNNLSLEVEGELKFQES